jgi:integrase
VQWDEIDLDKRVWTVPATRMKAAREHRIPLSERATCMLRDLERTRGATVYVFPGAKQNAPLSVTALDMVLRRLGQNITVHGFRSSFRDWAGNETHFPREVAEAALAHVVGDKAEQAYRRGDALEKRRQLMAAWANFCERVPTGHILSIHNRVSVART